MSKDEILALVKHVGCGDVDNHGACNKCDTIRELLRSMLVRVN